MLTNFDKLLHFRNQKMWQNAVIYLGPHYIEVTHCRTEQTFRLYILQFLFYTGAINTLCLVVYGSTVSALRALLSFFIPSVFIFFCIIFTALYEWNKVMMMMMLMTYLLF